MADSFIYQTAIQDFRRARRKAAMEQMMAFLKGKSTDLLSYEVVRKQLKVTGTSTGKLEEIPVAAIVGSVGRYRDFTRNFLPLNDSDEGRWSAVRALALGQGGFPPIEVYQIGKVYFVLDGNHRVSVAKELGAELIEAFVIKIQTKVPISADEVEPDELALKAEYAQFLARTHLDSLNAGVDLQMSLPGKYQALEEQIEEHRYFMGMEQRRDISHREAVESWYQHVYQPVVEIIKNKELLADFPTRTLTDLYLWISEYRATLRQDTPAALENEIAAIYENLPVSPDMNLDQLILDAEYVDFLDQTQIDQIRPDANIRVTAPGKYRNLKNHIEVHRHFLGLEQQQEISPAEAVAHWYDTVYLPIIMFIQRRGMLRDFPHRTETDLYLWIAEHRSELEKRLGWTIRPEAAAADLAESFGQTAGGRLSRVSEKLFDLLTPDEFESGPATGVWRKEQVAPRRYDHLFSSILVPINGRPESWAALEQAMAMARHEDASLYGLHVIKPESPAEEQEAALTVQNEFLKRCQEVGVPAQFAIEEGEIARVICDRARWVDLVLVKLSHPPGTQPLSRLQSGFRTLLRRCSRPVLAVPAQATPIHRALLAYDGSPKADEALFIGAYISGYFGVPLVVLTVSEMGRTSKEMLSLARSYLRKRDVKATFLDEAGDVGETILTTAEAYACDLVIMGSYGRNPLMEMMVGSALDRVMQDSKIPLLICR